MILLNRIPTKIRAVNNNQIINGAEIEVSSRMYKDLALILENYTVKEVIYGIDKRYRIKIK